MNKKAAPGDPSPIAVKSHSCVAGWITAGNNAQPIFDLIVIYQQFLIYIYSKSAYTDMSREKYQNFLVFLFFADNIIMTGSEFVNRIDIELKRQGKKRPELAKFLNISTQSFVDWNKRGNLPSANIALKIAQFLNTSVEYLITGKETELTTEQRNLLQGYDKLDKRDRQTVLDLIETMLKKQKRRKKTCIPIPGPYLIVPKK
jgi:transcriptional regulator with XRE-family HTH domain